MSGPVAKDPIDQWIMDRVAGRSFVDIGGIGVGAWRERTTLAAQAGASKVMMADIRPADFWEWKAFRKKSAEAGVQGVIEFPNVDIRRRDTLAALGVCDIVHSTGILYHLQSPAEAVWNLRSVTGQYLITNTVTFPSKVENEHGVVNLPENSVLFIAALSRQDRKVLNKYYTDKYQFTIDKVAPDPADGDANMPWVENGELTCWPYWYLYSDQAFRCLLKLCRLRIVDEWKWDDHALHVLCEVVR